MYIFNFHLRFKTFHRSAFNVTSAASVEFHTEVSKTNKLVKFSSSICALAIVNNCEKRAPSCGVLFSAAEGDFLPVLTQFALIKISICSATS